MKLPRPSLRKLFREDFSGRSPIRIQATEVTAESKRLRQQIAEIDGTHVTVHPGDKDSRSRTLCRFTIPDPADDRYYYRSDELRLEYDDQGRLSITRYHYRDRDLSALVSDLDEVKLFVRHVREHYARRAAGARKRQKVRDFKTKAIVAQVRRLAAEEQFEFTTSTDTVKLRLYVRLSAADLIEIQIPFKRFESVLPTLQSTIRSLRELYREGLRFKMTPVTRLPRNLEWERHES